MSTRRFPQYAKSVDPRVLEAVRRNKAGAQRQHEAAVAFAEAQGAEKGEYYANTFGGKRSIRAVGGSTKPTTGQWKQGYGGYGWVPYKNNPLHAEFDSIRFDAEEVPGLAGLLMGSGVMYSPNPFEHDGAVYVGLSGQPNDLGRNDPDPADGGWFEIKASEYHAAVEAVTEASE